MLYELMFGPNQLATQVSCLSKASLHLLYPKFELAVNNFNFSTVRLKTLIILGLNIIIRPISKSNKLLSLYYTKTKIFVLKPNIKKSLTNTNFRLDQNRFS